VHDPADHEGRTDRQTAPIVAQAVWIEETLKDAPGGVAEKPNGGYKQQRAAEWLSEDGRESAARSRDASACLGRDLEGQRADDHVEHTLHKETPAGEPRDRAEAVHRAMVRRILPHGLWRAISSGHRAELAERRMSRTLAGERVLLCPEGNRHQPAPLIAYTLSWRDPDRRRRIAVVRHERFSEREDAGPRSPDTRERRMDTTTLLVIVLVVLLLGGGGFFYRRRI